MADQIVIPSMSNRKYTHEEGSKFIRCVDADAGDLLFVITAGREQNAKDVMQDLNNGHE